MDDSASVALGQGAASPVKSEKLDNNARSRKQKRSMKRHFVRQSVSFRVVVGGSQIVLTTAVTGGVGDVDAWPRAELRAASSLRPTQANATRLV